MGRVDLHVHSTASDGECAPADVVHRAHDAGLDAIALTDHDTVGGLESAAAGSVDLGVRVVAGCEFSVSSDWGEMHLLAYFLPIDHPELGAFLQLQRARRAARGIKMVERLNGVGVDVTEDEVLSEAAGATLGRPHVARALVRRGTVEDVREAFRKYLGRSRPAFVPKQLPTLAEVVSFVRRLGGVSCAAHLGSQANKRAVKILKSYGVDALEILHPAHDDATVKRLDSWARTFGLLRTGGSDWHGDSTARPALGSLDVPSEWLDRIEELHEEREKEQ